LLLPNAGMNTESMAVPGNELRLIF